MNEEKIIAIVPCHNEETKVLNVIKKLTNQVDEIVVVDDGSTDTTDQVLKGLEQNASFPIRYYKQKNHSNSKLPHLIVQILN